MSPSDLDWVIVAGAGGSIGQVLLRRFAASGRHIVALDRKVDEIQADASPEVLICPVDLSSEAEVKAALEKSVPKTDRIGVLINAVGLIWNEPLVRIRGGSVEPHSVDDWRLAIEANLTAPFIIASIVAARMVRSGGGTIINFSSIAARGNPGQAAYSAAKSGIEGLTRTMAAELGPMGIRVNAIAPGFIDTPSTRAALSEQQLTQLSGKTPLRRLGSYDELLDAIDFLTRNAFANGVVLDLDGGLKL